MQSVCPMRFQTTGIPIIYPLKNLAVYSAWGGGETRALYGTDAMKRDQVYFENQIKLAKMAQEKGMLFLVTTMDMEIELIDQFRKDELLTLCCTGVYTPFQNQLIIYII